MSNFHRYAVVDGSGQATGFYAREIHGDSIPQEAIPITHEAWEQYTQRPDAWRFANGELVPAPPPPAPGYAELRAEAYAGEIGPIEQQIDALYKSMTFPAGSEAAAIQAKRQAIKDRHPKQ